MREIKFKIWSKTRKDFIRLEIDTILNLANDDKTVKLDTYNNQVVFLQYTGLKDKNGVEIYEGDIIKVEKYVTSDGKKYEDDIDTVLFEKSFFLYGNDYLYNVFKKSEVIGNIYENPELLEQK